ncbi:hypothetical protein N8Y82_03405 [Gammaproteobacteria bacterium]|nr:hypothetical protein [Gammaproteobacteria bacterium]
MARLQEFYKDTVRAQLTEEFSYSNPMMIPRIEMISINVGLGEATRLLKSCYLQMLVS